MQYSFELELAYLLSSSKACFFYFHSDLRVALTSTVQVVNFAIFYGPAAVTVESTISAEGEQACLVATVLYESTITYPKGQSG